MEEPAMSNLPYDLTVEILSRLPAKSLLRFKCVSRRWSSSITASDFVKKHLNQAIQHNKINLMLKTHTLLYSIDNPNPTSLESEPELKAVQHPFNDTTDKSVEYPLRHYDGIKMIGSCDGLLSIYYLNGGICLLNPCTREFYILPHLSFDADVRVVCEPSVANGFGYDPVSNDYKLVRIHSVQRRPRFLDEYDIQVYTLGTDVWRRIENTPYHIFELPYPGEYLTGTIHWLGRENRDSDSNEATIIVGFDLGEEKFKELEMPKYSGHGAGQIQLRVLGGCLSMLSFHNDHIELWVMEGYGVRDSWTKRFVISHQSEKEMRPLYYPETGILLMERDGEELVVYNSKNVQGKALKVTGILRNFASEPYVGSLVSLKSNSYLGSTTETTRSRFDLWL